MTRKTAAPPPTPDRGLTAIERWYIQCLIAWTHNHGEPPTTVELARWIERGVSTVHHTLAKLEAKGYLSRHPPDVAAAGLKRRFIVMPAARAA